MLNFVLLVRCFLRIRLEGPCLINKVTQFLCYFFIFHLVYLQYDKISTQSDRLHCNTYLE